MSVATFGCQVSRPQADRVGRTTRVLPVCQVLCWAQGCHSGTGMLSLAARPLAYLRQTPARTPPFPTSSSLLSKELDIFVFPEKLLCTHLFLYLSNAVWKPGIGQSAGPRATNKHSPAPGLWVPGRGDRHTYRSFPLEGANCWDRCVHRRREEFRLDSMCVCVCVFSRRAFPGELMNLKARDGVKRKTEGSR